MNAFENLKIAFIEVPTCKDVLDRVRRDEPCGGDPVSEHCAFGRGKDLYLMNDLASCEVCQDCPRFKEELRKLMADWAEWVLAMEDTYT